jgi:hypothetical protein
VGTQMAFDHASLFLAVGFLPGNSLFLMKTNSELETTNNKPNEKKDGYEKAADPASKEFKKNFALA